MRATVTYTARAPEHRRSDERQLLGVYEVVYEDGVTVLVPHTGYVGTVSAIPLDLDSEVLLAAAQARRDCDELERLYPELRREAFDWRAFAAAEGGSVEPAQDTPPNATEED